MILLLETVFIKLLEKREIYITESGFSNVAGTVLLHWLSIQVIFFNILQKFRNNFPGENLQKLLLQLSWDHHLKSPFWFSEDS